MATPGVWQSGCLWEVVVERKNQQNVQFFFKLKLKWYKREFLSDSIYKLRKKSSYLQHGHLLELVTYEKWLLWESWGCRSSFFQKVRFSRSISCVEKNWPGTARPQFCQFINSTESSSTVKCYFYFFRSVKIIRK